jgi:hypothetical protein
MGDIKDAYSVLVRILKEKTWGIQAYIEGYY